MPRCGDGPAFGAAGTTVELAGAGGNGQQRNHSRGVTVIAKEAHSLRAKSLGLADGGVQVDGHGRVAGSGPRGLGLMANNWRVTRYQLTDMSPPWKLSRDVPTVYDPGDHAAQEHRPSQEER